ncbi:substrate-binding domain-containing protein [Sorangium sp. So ce1014]|uniref:substrate-binding domain-containing protein n=1 Tax=Sorangium sp. So ce1014 TaxID=3133326 RepID=UPI003F634EEF
MTIIGRCWMAAFGLALMTTGCGAGDTTEGGKSATTIKRTQLPENEFTPAELEATIDALVAEINEHPIEPMQMTVLLKSVSRFFAPVATGANRALGELGVKGNVVGPLEQTGEPGKGLEFQNEQIAQAVAEGAEGIGISPFGDGNLAAIDEAVAKKVHVVTLDADVLSSKRAIYVGTLNEAAGNTAGKTLLPMLPEGPGTVVIHGSLDADWVDGLDRTRGARAVLEAAGYEVLVRQVLWTDEGEPEDIAWMKDQIETADPPVVGMIGLFAVAFRCGMAAEAAQRPDLPIVGFDFDPRTVDYMRKGFIRATHAQRQYYEGYLVPYILYGIKSIGLDATRAILAPQMVDDHRFNLGLDVVSGEKVDVYSDFLREIGAEQ